MPDYVDFNNKNVTIYKVQETDLLDDDFESTVEEFINYYHMDCLQDIREQLAQVYLLKLSGRVVGFVTLARAAYGVYFKARGGDSDNTVPDMT